MRKTPKKEAEAQEEEEEDEEEEEHEEEEEEEEDTKKMLNVSYKSIGQPSPAVLHQTVDGL